MPTFHRRASQLDDVAARRTALSVPVDRSARCLTRPVAHGTSVVHLLERESDVGDRGNGVLIGNTVPDVCSTA